MIDFSEIKKQYPNSLHQFERGLLREYLQYQLLSLIFKHNLSRKLSFLGGTCLRIVHNLPRFSEDIDFDNKELTREEIEELSNYLSSELEKLGYEVEIRIVDKGAFRVKIKFPGLLYEQKLSPIEEETILIQVDTFDQGYSYSPELFILNKFEFFDQILVTPKPVLLSQKLWTITQRKRFKGRDFFDVMFMLQSTRPDLGYLQHSFGTDDIEKVKEIIFEHLTGIDYKVLVDDVRPFLQKPQEAERILVFEEFLNQELLRA
jgi:predicted nucleotidyltransferase component of viral defense system